MKKLFDSIFGSHYEYGLGSRILEVFALFTYTSISILIFKESWTLLGKSYLGQVWWIVPTLGLISYITADFVSGLVHWLADSFGSEDMPILGPHYIKPFRDHHSNPDDITKHDFVETNGNNSLVTLLVLVPTYFWVPLATTTWGMCFGLFMVMFNLGIFVTNMTHSWAHMEEPPVIAVFLQKHGLILTKENHNVHHTPPHESYYCITNGWLNPVLEKIQFFQRAKKLMYFFFKAEYWNSKTH